MESKLQQASRMLHEAKRYNKELDEHIRKSGATKFLTEQKRDVKSSITAAENVRNEVIAEEHRKEKMGEDYSVDAVHLDKVLSEGASKIWSNAAKDTKRR